MPKRMIHTKKKQTKKQLADYLKQPYARVLLPDEESGTYTGLIVEFAGCIAQGNTVEETYQNLEQAAESWLEASIELGKTIPDPDAKQEFSGKIALRLPKGLHQKVSELANREGISLNQFLLQAIAEKIGAHKFCEKILQGAEDRLVTAALRAQTVKLLIGPSDLLYGSAITISGTSIVPGIPAVSASEKVN